MDATNFKRSHSTMSGVISEEQRQLNRALHAENKNYGNRADGAGVATNLPAALRRMHELGFCNTVLDYGTGKGKLVKHLKQNLPESIRVDGYDPAVEEYCVHPKDPYHVVICLDVLEHIEIESIDSVLNDIKRLTSHFCYLVIDLQPAVKTLKDGRNAHILLAPHDWWVTKLSQLFPCIATFPLYHESGSIQKIVIACTNNPSQLDLVYSFLMKLKLFNIRLAGGILGGRKTKKE